MIDTFNWIVSLEPWVIPLFAIPLGVLVIGAMVVAQKFKGPSSHGDARFATMREIKEAGLLGGSGVIVGKYKGKFLTYAAWFVALLAATRTGKGVALVIPTLLSWLDSLVVMDVKEENFSITSLFRKKILRHDVYLFSPFSLKTHRWNPLAYIEEMQEHERIPEILSVGYSIYPNSQSESGDWNGMARSLFVGLALMLMETEGMTASIGEILRQSSGKGKPLKKHLQKIIKDRQDAGNPLSSDCVDLLQTYIDSAPNTASSIMNTFKAPLTIWMSPVVDAATAVSDFSLRDVRRRKMAIYVNIPVNKLDESKLVINLFFSQMIKQNTDIQLGFDKEKDEEKRIKHKCLLMLDEALAAGYVPILLDGSAFIASYGLILVTVAHSMQQLCKPVSQGGYGREGGESLIDNHGLRICFKPKSVVAAKEISDRLSEQTVKSISRNRRKRFDGTETERGRALMLTGEILNMPPNKQIMFLDDCRPIYCDKVQYFKEPVFVNRLKSVCPELAAIKGLPTFEQLKAVLVKDGLSAPVPMQSVRQKETRILVEQEKPIQNFDFSHLPEVSAEPMSEQAAEAFADALLSTIGLEPGASV